MKKIILFTLLISVHLIAAKNKIDIAREEQNVQNDTLIYNTVGLEMQPEFPGGIQKLYDFFNSNFKMPEAGIKGRIVAMFVIEKDGSLSRIKALRPLDLDTKKEIIRVLKLTPNWNPGMQNGKIVRTLYSVQFPMNYNNKKEPRKR